MIDIREDIMVRKKKILETIENEYDNTELSGSKAFSKVEKKVYPELPLGDNESIELFDFVFHDLIGDFKWMTC